MKDTREWWLAAAAVLFVICPGIGLLASHLSAPWHVLGAALVALGAAAWLFWIVRNYQVWKHEFGRSRKHHGRLHKRKP